MPVIHFLNVKEGDCSIIEHMSGHITVIDVCNAGQRNIVAEATDSVLAKLEEGVLGNFNQKKYPVNPVSYLEDRAIDSVFRFVLTHPDMDHLDGIKYFFETFSPINFWDTDNTKENDFSEDNYKYDEDDWDFYTSLRDCKPTGDPKRLVLHSGANGKYFNQNEDGDGGGDGLHILAPTKELVSDANDCSDFNDCSYVLLYKTKEFKIVFGGDSHDQTWDHILEEHPNLVANIDLLIAPHHGRDSGRSYDFLDVLKPKLTLFGNARSQHLAYDAWSSRDLPIITNNQAGTIIMAIEAGSFKVYVTHKAFAKKVNPDTFFSSEYDVYFLLSL